MKLPNIQDIPFESGMRIILRAPLNVPLDEHGVVSDTSRLVSFRSTLKYILERGARVALIGHIGRGNDDSLKPVFEALKKDFPDIRWGGDAVSTDAPDHVHALPEEGGVVLFENIRQHESETSPEQNFITTLARLGDTYVCDAFPDAHRAHASLTGLAEILPTYFGDAFHSEYKALSDARMPQDPSLLILGGAKFDTKLSLVEQLGQKYDIVFLGGALINDVFKEKGYEIGTSLVSGTDVSPLLTMENLMLPVDVTVHNQAGTRIAMPDSIESDDSVFDIGPQSMELLRQKIRGAKTILWNGPLGYYEGGYDIFTKKCAEYIAEQSDATTIVGGGDTLAAIHELGLDDAFTHLSTAGGAMLTFLEKGTLPILDVFTAKGQKK